MLRVLRPASVSGRSFAYRARAARLLRLQFLRAAGFAVMLDLGLRDVLVLGADHPENRSRGVLATRHRAELPRRLLPSYSAERERHGLRRSAAAYAVAAAKRAVDCGAGPLDGLALDQRRELRGELVDERLNVHCRR